MRGAAAYGEPGVFMTFEETGAELAQNARSLGFDLDDLVARGSCGSTSCTRSPTASRRTGTSTWRRSSSVWATRSMRSAPGASCSTRSSRSSPACPTRSVGSDLGTWAERDLLRFHATRPTLTGLEMHLTAMHKAILRFAPRIVILDPLNSFISAGNDTEVKSMLMRLIDFLKVSQITGFFTSLTGGGTPFDHTDAAISSLIDTWLVLLAQECGGERNRVLSILKSRGMAHSNQSREFLITGQGVEICDVYLGPSGVLTGSARLTREAAERAEALARNQEIERASRTLEQRRTALEAQIAALWSEFEVQQAKTLALIEGHLARESQSMREREAMFELAFPLRGDGGEDFPLARPLGDDQRLVTSSS